MDATLLFIKLRGFEASSWGTTPFSIENEVGAPNLSSGLTSKGLGRSFSHCQDQLRVIELSSSHCQGQFTVKLHRVSRLPGGLLG